MVNLKSVYSADRRKARISSLNYETFPSSRVNFVHDLINKVWLVAGRDLI